VGSLQSTAKQAGSQNEIRARIASGSRAHHDRAPAWDVFDDAINADLLDAGFSAIPDRTRALGGAVRGFRTLYRVLIDELLDDPGGCSAGWAIGAIDRVQRKS
jgi:hypothetical protein